MAQAQRKFDDQHNYYVPGMQAGGDLGQALNGRIEFGVLATADTDGILAAHSIAEEGETLTFAGTYSADVMGPFGRNVTVVASGTATSAVVVWGRDYLGQKMKEQLTLNGTTPVVGLKAFKHIDKVEYAGTADRTIDVGWGVRIGLPYVTLRVAAVYMDNATASAPTFVAPVYTDPQTLTTGDPRGTIQFAAAPNDARKFEADIEFTNVVNDAGNGGLHGIRHFFA